MLEIRGRHAYTYNLVTNTFKNQGLWSIYGEAMDPYRIHIKKNIRIRYFDMDPYRIQKVWVCCYGNGSKLQSDPS